MKILITGVGRNLSTALQELELRHLHLSQKSRFGRLVRASQWHNNVIVA